MYWLSIAAVIASFAVGFLLANALNRNDINTLRAENDKLKNSQTESKQTDSEFALSDEEIQKKIADADRNPNDFAFQKNLGLALSRYAAMKQDIRLLTQVGRILNRVYENNPKDYPVLVTLGNIYFDIGYSGKDNGQFQKAREFYQKALEQKPNDVDVRTDLGLTYFLSVPPEPDKAIAEFQKSLRANPLHEKTLQVMAQTVLSENKIDEAEKLLARLKAVNPDNQVISEIESQISQAKSNSQKQ